MKLTREQWKRANWVLTQSMGMRNADVLVPAMLNALNIKYGINKEFYLRIDKSHLCEGILEELEDDAE